MSSKITCSFRSRLQPQSNTKNGLPEPDRDCIHCFKSLEHGTPCKSHAFYPVALPTIMKLPNMHNVTWPCLVLFDLLLLLALRLLNLLLLIVVEAASRHLVQTKDRLVRVLDEDKLSILALAAEAHVGDSANNTPTVGER